MPAQAKTESVKQFSLRIPEDVWAWAFEQAKKERSSLNSWLLRLMDEKREAKHADAL